MKIQTSHRGIRSAAAAPRSGRCARPGAVSGRGPRHQAQRRFRHRQLTSEQVRFRVVATLGGNGDATPVRFVATLAPGQTAVISVPRGIGETDAEVTLVRRGDRLLVFDSRIAMR